MPDSDTSSLSVHDLPQVILLAALLAHSAEHAEATVFITLQLPKLARRAVLDNLAVTQYEDSVEVSDGAEAVRDDDQRAVTELLADASLN